MPGDLRLQRRQQACRRGDLEAPQSSELLAPHHPAPTRGRRLWSLKLGPTRFLRFPLMFPVSPQRPRGASPKS